MWKGKARRWWTTTGVKRVFGQCSKTAPGVFLWGRLGAFRALLGLIAGPLKPSSSPLGPSCLGALLGRQAPLEAVLGVSRGRLGAPKGRPGAFLGRLGAIFGRPGAVWGPFGVVLGGCWAILGCLKPEEASIEYAYSKSPPPPAFPETPMRPNGGFDIGQAIGPYVSTVETSGGSLEGGRGEEEEREEDENE